jgi:hypothetical protein
LIVDPVPVVVVPLMLVGLVPAGAGIGLRVVVPPKLAPAGGGIGLEGVTIAPAPGVTLPVVEVLPVVVVAPLFKPVPVVVAAPLIPPEAPPLAAGAALAIAGRHRRVPATTPSKIGSFLAELMPWWGLLNMILP